MESTNTVAAVVDYIENNLDKKLTLDEIAEWAGYSKFYLNRLFLENTGYTIHKYIQMRRLTVAAEKLVYTKKPIVEIAFEANYDSQQSFTFAFHRLYGHPPQKYRAIEVHVPKFNKFKLKSNLVLLYQPTMKGEVIAA